MGGGVKGRWENAHMFTCPVNQTQFVRKYRNKILGEREKKKKKGGGGGGVGDGKYKVSVALNILLSRLCLCLVHLIATFKINEALKRVY